MSFWTLLKKPFLALAPMAGVTDTAFRRICKEFGADVIYTEFVSAIALLHDNQKTKEIIAFDTREQPVVVQIFGNDPEHFFKASKILEEMGYAGIDINFGCPAYKVVKTGGGVSLMRDFDRCFSLVQACCEAVRIPISIKIRSSINCVASKEEIDYAAQNLFYCHSERSAAELKNPAERMPAASPGCFDKLSMTAKGRITAIDLIKKINALPIAAVMIHGRSYEKPFDGPADTHMITEVKKIFPGITLGNGGVYTPEDAKAMLNETGCDGVGLGRGTHGSPWLFRQIKEYLTAGSYQALSWEEKKEVMLKHASYALATKGMHGLIELRKHLLWYAKGIPNGKHLKAALAQVKTMEDVEDILKAV